MWSAKFLAIKLFPEPGKPYKQIKTGLLKIILAIYLILSPLILFIKCLRLSVLRLTQDHSARKWFTMSKRSESNGRGDRDRTCDLQFWRLALLPAELLPSTNTS